MISRERTAVFGQPLAERRRRGRPVKTAKPAPVTPTSIRIPDPVYAALCRIATRQRVSLHKLLNNALTSFAAGNFQ